MQKILYFHHAIGLGGAPKSLSFLIAGLDRTRFDPIVVMPKRSGNEAVKKLLTDAGATVIEEKDIRPFNGSTVAPCNTAKEKAYALAAYPLLVRCAKELVAKINPDIVHLNSTCLVAAAKGAHLASPDIPVITHVREPLLYNWWGRQLAKLNRKHIDHFISIDKAGLVSIDLKTKNSTVIYNFVDEKIFHPNETDIYQTRQGFGWSKDDIIFLSLSRISPSNGALEMVQLINAQDSKLNKHAKFIIAGFDNENNDYTDKTRALIDQSSRCFALDFISDVVPLLNAIDVIIAPFTSPHSARSIFEGASMGKPSLVTNLPNLTELIIENKTGFIFDWDNPKLFVDAVNKLCQPDLRSEMGKVSLEFAKSNFSARGNVEKTMQVYHKILGHSC